MKNSTFFFFLLLTSFLTAQSPTQILRGTVTEQGSNGRIPVKRAAVYIMGIDETTSNGYGEFELDLNKCHTCKPGRTNLVIKVNSSHGIAQHPYLVPFDPSSNEINIEVAASNKLIISGIVKDKKSGKFIKAIKASAVIPGFGPISTKTDDFGIFEFILNKNGIGDKQAVRLVFTDAQRSKYSDHDEVVFTSQNPTPITIYLDECTNCGERFELKIGRDRRTGIKVETGDIISIKAKGKMEVGKFVGISGPEGRDRGVLGLSLKDYSIIPSWNHAALCYRFGTTDEWKYYDEQGENKHIIQDKGYLEFMINDKKQSDNEGEYDVEILIRR